MDNINNTTCEYKSNGILINSNYENIIDIIDNEKKMDIQTKMLLIPFYINDNSLCTLLSKNYNDYEFINDALEQKIACGNVDDMTNKKMAGIVNLNGIKICLFSYFSLWSNNNNFTNGNLIILFKTIIELLDDNINELIIPPFGINNKKSFKQTAYVLFTNIKKCCEDNIFNKINKIKFIGLKNNSNNDIITHLNHIIKIHHFNKNICIICCENPITHYFIGCGHADYCLRCITNCTFSFTLLHMCPYCKQKSSIQEIPLNIINLCDHDDKKYYVPECNCSLFISCNDCMKNNTNYCCSFEINTSIQLFML